MGGRDGTTIEPRIVKTAPPALLLERTKRGTSIITGTMFVQGSSASHTPSWSASINVQLAEQQPSLSFAVPSSHCSPVSMIPFPQMDARAVIVAAGTRQPSSMPRAKSTARGEYSVPSRLSPNSILHLRNVPAHRLGSGRPSSSAATSPLLPRLRPPTKSPLREAVHRRLDGDRPQARRLFEPLYELGIISRCPPARPA